MSETALTILQDTFEMMGVYNPGDQISAADQSRGLVVLNDLMDSWSNESLTTFCVSQQSFVLVANQGQYPVGPGSAYSSVRPIRIMESPGTCFIRDNNQNDYPVDVITQSKYNLIGLKTNTSDIPDTLFYDPQMPQGMINLFPVPILPYTLFYDQYSQLAEFSNLETAMTLPPGYGRAIKSNLALELWPYYLDSDPSQVIVAKASVAKANVKRSNTRPQVALYDAEIVSRASPTYNIYRDRQGGA